MFNTLKNNPLIAIWVTPRKTTQRLLDSAKIWQIIVLAILLGITYFFEDAAQDEMGTDYSLKTILIMAFTLGPLLGLLYVYIMSAFIKWTGQLIGGRGDYRGINIALTFGAIPEIWVMGLVWLIFIPMFGIEIFAERNPVENWTTLSPMSKMVLYSFPLWFGAMIWIVVVRLKSLAEVQGFSVGKAILNSVLSLFAMLILMFSIGSPVFMFIVRNFDKYLAYLVG